MMGKGRPDPLQGRPVDKWSLQRPNATAMVLPSIRRVSMQRGWGTGPQHEASACRGLRSNRTVATITNSLF
eukprot:8463532-Lingulodinium_polyedra.AAC.1